MGLIMTALSPSYDFFMFYFTLVITPMTLLCGVFFPVDQLPSALQIASQFLPLTHAIDLARPLIIGQVPQNILLHVFVLLTYGIVGFYIALVLIRKRLLK
jgi:lipooligosaccharide transport system permease protein